jgi:DNA polymerase-3 subunit chi
MRVDFYQLSRDPAETAVALIAQKVVESGNRLLVVAEDPLLHARISDALWRQPDSFLANGPAGSGHDERQPILLSDSLEPANGATFLVLADGQWRDGEGFERVFLFFDEKTVAASRNLWRELGEREGTERHFWKQDGGKWEKAG